jgi:hypothetical protein
MTASELLCEQRGTSQLGAERWVELANDLHDWRAGWAQWPCLR